MVHGQHSHGGIGSIASQGQSLGAGLNGGRRAGGPLADHHRTGFDSENGLRRLVGACPGTDVDHRPGITERRAELGAYPRVGPPGDRVTHADGVIGPHHGSIPGRIQGVRADQHTTWPDEFTVDHRSKHGIIEPAVDTPPTTTDR